MRESLLISGMCVAVSCINVFVWLQNALLYLSDSAMYYCIFVATPRIIVFVCQCHELLYLCGRTMQYSTCVAVCIIQPSSQQIDG